jgi:hypothetical protein
MIYDVEEHVSLSLNGRQFDLVWEGPGFEGHSCYKCALLGNVCKASRNDSLLALCCNLVGEPETYFIERKPEFKPKGILEKEILTSALAEYKKAMEAQGNSPRAQKVEELLDRI